MRIYHLYLRESHVCCLAVAFHAKTAENDVRNLGEDNIYLVLGMINVLDFAALDLLFEALFSIIYT